MEYIQSKDNKTIKRIISLGQRKNRQKYGEYIVEGIRSIRDIAAMGAVKTIVIRESKAQICKIPFTSPSGIHSIAWIFVTESLDV